MTDVCKIIARPAGFIGVTILSTGGYSHLIKGGASNFVYRPTLEQAAEDVRRVTGQTAIEVINLIPEGVVLGAFSGSTPEWVCTTKDYIKKTLSNREW